MVSKNVFEKFRELWFSLKPQEQKDLWSILSALRGPDNVCDFRDSNVKELTTAKIRYFLFNDDEKLKIYYFDDGTSYIEPIGAIINKQPINKHHDIETIIQDYDLPYHFVSHIRYAYETIIKYTSNEKNNETC